ncbi:ctr copper transporter [Xylaria bambusicola]|uniref:ctr copper transporter n=1 Tax=Xylaria bambusicola TaxID=326684 RepID=UPI0020089171|nr:ctr copper transporter [Xylaria bambusicola]KAI0517522.1 ctr copper transporter [Xylaria bambusicola]
MSHGGGMSMDDSSCTTHMLWNWNTIGACFFAESWKIKTEGMMAATCIGVFLLAILLEFVRRLGKEYDDLILRQFQQHADERAAMAKLEDNCCSAETRLAGQTVIFRATALQQLIRSFIHAVAFGIAYILMLIAMAFNGYVIILIIVGAGFGKFLCDWMTARVVVGVTAMPAAKTVGVSEEATVCCG